jgi:hypothetical protein
VQQITERTGTGERDMELIIGLAFMAAIWASVIWGSAYFNKNIQ